MQLPGLWVGCCFSEGHLEADPCRADQFHGFLSNGQFVLEPVTQDTCMLTSTAACRQRTSSPTNYSYSVLKVPGAKSTSHGLATC